jgi:cation transporter-like permease
MAQPRSKLGNLATIALVGIPLFAILAVSGWYAAGAWVSVSGPPMPATGYVAMTLGVVFSVVVGCGLMALVFYSHRHGYDDAAQDATQWGEKHDD